MRKKSEYLLPLQHIPVLGCEVGELLVGLFQAGSRNTFGQGLLQRLDLERGHLLVPEEMKVEGEGNAHVQSTTHTSKAEKREGGWKGTLPTNLAHFQTFLHLGT